MSSTGQKRYYLYLLSGCCLLLHQCRPDAPVQKINSAQYRHVDTPAPVDPHMAYFHRSMEALGETAGLDTHFNQYLYLGYWYLQRSRLISIRNVAHDTISFISFCRYTSDYDRYMCDTGLRWPYYIYPLRLKKMARGLPRSNAGKIFRYADSLVQSGALRPFGTEDTARSKGDIVDGGYWLMYGNGKDCYESQAASLEQMERLIGSLADLEQMGGRTGTTGTLARPGSCK